MDSTRRLVADLDWLGAKIGVQIRLRTCDSGSAVQESMPTVEFVIEESPVEEHQSNGTIKVTVREIQKQVRVMKSALEERTKCEVPSSKNKSK